MLKMIHPIMPFMSEEIWQLLDDRKDGETIMKADYPKFDESLINKTAEEEIEFVQNVVTAIRNIRGEMNIPPSKQINVYLKTKTLSNNQIKYISSLAKVAELKAEENLEKPKASASAVVKGADVFVPLEGLIDLDVERKRLEKEILRLEGMLVGVTKKLSNENFVSKAPANVIENEKTKKADWESTIEKLKSILEDLK